MSKLRAAVAFAALALVVPAAAQAQQAQPSERDEDHLLRPNPVIQHAERERRQPGQDVGCCPEQQHLEG